VIVAVLSGECGCAWCVGYKVKNASSRSCGIFVFLIKDMFDPSGWHEETAVHVPGWRLVSPVRPFPYRRDIDNSLFIL